MTRLNVRGGMINLWKDDCYLGFHGNRQQGLSSLGLSTYVLFSFLAFPFLKTSRAVEAPYGSKFSFDIDGHSNTERSSVSYSLTIPCSR